jgi:2-methylcitrate dehydratase PrpD
VDLSSFSEASFERNRALARQVTLTAGEPFASAHPKAWGAKVSVQFTDGSRSVCARHVKGDPEAPLSEHELKSKAQALLELGGIDDTASVIESILGMADGGICVELPRGSIGSNRI